MIREFHIDDLARFEPNEMSVPDDVLPMLEDDCWWNYTLERGGVVRAILCGFEQAERQWAVFCLISKRFCARDSVELRRFLARAIERMQPKKIWTLSCPDAVVSKWHEFMGFISGEPVEVNGKKYLMWSRLWDGKQPSCLA